MAKITFPSVTSAYRGFISEVRNQLVMWKQHVERNPDSDTDLLAAMGALALALGSYFTASTAINIRNSADTQDVAGTLITSSNDIVEVAAPSTAAIVVAATVVPVKNSAGSKTVNGSTNTITAGEVASVNLPSTAALITSTQTLTGVTPSGVYATTVTFTVTNGVISAIALS